MDTSPGIAKGLDLQPQVIPGSAAGPGRGRAVIGPSGLLPEYTFFPLEGQVGRLIAGGFRQTREESMSSPVSRLPSPKGISIHSGLTLTGELSLLQGRGIGTTKTALHLLPPIVPLGNEQRVMVKRSTIDIIPDLSIYPAPHFGSTGVEIRVLSLEQATEEFGSLTVAKVQGLELGEEIQRRVLVERGREGEAAVLFPTLIDLPALAGVPEGLDAPGVAKPPVPGYEAGAGKGAGAPGAPTDC